MLCTGLPGASAQSDVAHTGITPSIDQPRPEVADENGNLHRLDLPQSRLSEYTPAADNLREEIKDMEPLAAKVTKLQETGPADKRYNIVFVGDGYTSREQDKYLRDARAIWDKFDIDEPFHSYKNYFNVYAVEVISRDSGVSGDPAGVQRDTALGIEVGCFNTPRLMCVDTRLAKRYAANAPGADIVIAMGNTDAYAAGGYPGVSAVSARSYDAAEATLHEIGHSMGGVGDEYFYDNRTYTGRELAAPNLSIYDSSEMRRRNTKWADMLGESTPDGGRIGTFEGGGVEFSRGVYRPSNDSRMRNTFEKFNSVTIKALVDALKRRVPDAQPGGGNTPIVTPTSTPTSDPAPTSTPTNDPAPTTTTTDAPAPNGFYENTERLSIRDYDSASSSVESRTSNADRVKLAINIDHSCLQNLEIAVTTPDGSRNVVKRSGYAYRCTEWRGEKSDTFTMRSKSDGRWSLEVADKQRRHTGTLNSWSITLS